MMKKENQSNLKLIKFINCKIFFRNKQFNQILLYKKLSINILISQRASVNSNSTEQQEKILRENSIGMEKINLGNATDSNTNNFEINNTKHNNKSLINISDCNVSKSQKSENNNIVIPSNVIHSNKDVFNSYNIKDTEKTPYNSQKKIPIIINQNENNPNAKNNYNNDGLTIIKNTNSNNFNEKEIQKINDNNDNKNNNITYTPALLRKIKQIENILSQKLINISELRSIAWKGLPYGKI